MNAASGPRVFLSYAKFNLYLAVRGRRPDGFHEIDTVLQSISLADRLTFTPDPGGALDVAVQGDVTVPSGRENLVWRALARLRECCGAAAGLRVTIAKRIPAGGGLGGGSSNAACALCAANRIWGLKLSREDLEEIASGVGSDVPFFVRGGTQRARGRGERLTPLPPLPRSSWIVIRPRGGLATSAVYGRFAPALTAPRSRARMVLDALAKRELSQIAGGMFNDLESAAVALHPEAAQVKAWMGQLGLTGVVLAGSGSSWVGWMMAPRAYAGLATQAGARGWRVFRVQPTRRGWSEEKSSTRHARRQGRAAQRYLGEQ